MSILRLGDSLKGLRQAVSLLVVVYSSGGIQSKKSQHSEKVDGAQSWRNQVQALRRALPVEAPAGTAGSPSTDGTALVKRCQPGKFTRALVSRDFIGGQLCLGSASGTDLSYADSSPPPHPEQNQASTINYFVGVNLSGPTGTACPRPQAHRATLIRRLIPRTQRRSPRRQPRARLEDRTFWGDCLGFEQPRPPEYLFLPSGYRKVV